jgi:hypothetical protein
MLFLQNNLPTSKFAKARPLLQWQHLEKKLCDITQDAPAGIGSLQQSKDGWCRLASSLVNLVRSGFWKQSWQEASGKQSWQEASAGVPYVGNMLEGSLEWREPF